MIVGGASGMGAVIAALFADEGARVVVADLKQEDAVTVAAGCAGDAVGLPVDITDSTQVDALAAEVADAVGLVDILVNSAGYAKFDPMTEITADELSRTMEVNLLGCFRTCQAFGRGMVECGSGKIVNIASTAGIAGVPGMVHYTAAKHGVVGLTRALAVEWGPHGVNVNCICPGSTTTPMLMSATDETWRQERSARIPLQRLATPEDQARAALFLASSDADYLTGTVITTDGGIAAMAAGTSDAALRV